MKVQIVVNGAVDLLEAAMSDPFANVDAASDEIIEIIANGLEARAADPSMLPVVEAYLESINVPDGAHIVDIGSGTGGCDSADRYPLPGRECYGIGTIGCADPKSQGTGDFVTEFDL